MSIGWILGLSWLLGFIVTSSYCFYLYISNELSMEESGVGVIIALFWPLWAPIVLITALFVKLSDKEKK